VRASIALVRMRAHGARVQVALLAHGHEYMTKISWNALAHPCAVAHLGSAVCPSLLLWWWLQLNGLYCRSGSGGGGYGADNLWQSQDTCLELVTRVRLVRVDIFRIDRQVRCVVTRAPDNDYAMP